MSWSVSGSGASSEVAASIESQFETSGPCSEPEETVRQNARVVIASALRAQTPDTTKVSVSAYGSQSSYTDSDGASRITNNLTISVRVTG